jgi:hypothetical protein
MGYFVIQVVTGYIHILTPEQEMQIKSTDVSVYNVHLDMAFISLL